MDAPITPAVFKTLVQAVTDVVRDRPLNLTLETDLNAIFGPHSPVYGQIFRACEAGISDGWMCPREAGGIKYGRVIKPAKELHWYSVDVVAMESVRGPHHSHPNGEIDLIMPLCQNAKFDDRPAGWIVYGPRSSHYPTVTEGRALVLYLLPSGAIEFTR